MSYRNRDCLWIGTEERSGWFRSPLRNADSSPQAWNEGGVLLNGGGYQFNSWGSHKVYQYEWGSATPMLMAQKLKSYYDGSYGRGLIYFYDPNIYNKNVLPARWADPSIALDSEGSGLVYGVEPTLAGLTTESANEYPLRTVTYNLASIGAGWRGREDALYLPIPDGYTLTFGVAGTASGSGAVMYKTSNRGVLSASNYAVDLLPVTGPVTNTYVEGTDTVRGVWLFVGKTATGAGSVSLSGMTARLVKTTLVEGEFSLGYGLDAYGEWPYGAYSPYSEIISAGPWSGGMGHSGTRFMSPPTFSTTGPLNDGQAGFAASFREVGSFAYA